MDFPEWMFAVEEAARKRWNVFDYKNVPFPWAEAYMEKKSVDDAATALIIKGVDEVVKHYPRLIQSKMSKLPV